MSRLDLSNALSPRNAYSPELLQSPVSPPLSYISARRPSLTPHTDVFAGSFRSAENLSSQPIPYSGLRNETSFEAEGEEEDANFRQSLQIDMKTLLGDAVGNMSISPTSRDVVLAARKGLFIIDLHSPLEVPRFLPQGGTWDVADVQWNPHPSNAELIVSTSSERLLIWNLLLIGKTSIEYILQSHYRAITDINWHCFEPDLVCSIGIDSWVWAWDLRAPSKPAFGLCAFNSAGTQVKWNRKDSNILATSHLDEVLIWDRRRGTVPLSRVKAHDAKIYGIDWSHSLPNQIISCSLDKKIKVWDINDLTSPQQTFLTDNPVWRARDLPFGHGIMSLSQRGGTSLEMWSYDNTNDPIESFDGHADVVKEFVWRSRSGYADDSGENDYQLITWSKDKTLRFWPLSRDTMIKAGVMADSATKRKAKSRQREETISFRSPPHGSDVQPALSAPRGHRTILAGVRAPVLETSTTKHPVLLPHHGSTARASRHEVLASMEAKRDKRSLSKQRSSILNITNVSPIAPAAAAERPDGTMSKGNAKGSKALANMDPSTWLQSIRTESVGPLHARLSSGSRPPSGPDRDNSDSLRRRRRSVSRSREEEAPRETEGSASLLDEINSVVNKLTPVKVKLERHDLSKHRSCTFGLHGPWGESASVNVFVRVTFTFPREYPHEDHPLGTPLVDIERSPLIPTIRRAYMRKKLKKIRETERPCLELCLRFLLFGDGGESRPGLDSGSSSDEERPSKPKRTKDFSASLIRDHQNLAEPRSSQGVFGPNGQLVCVFRSLPRLVKAIQQDSISVSPSIPTRGRETIPRLFQSPLQLSDAVRRLAVAANDRSFGFPGLKDPEDTENILRIMNNLLSFTQPRHHAPNDHHRSARSAENIQNNNYSLLPKRMTIVHVKDQAAVVGAHRAIAEEYVVMDASPSELASLNAEVARRHSRSDHERIFRCLVAVLHMPHKEANPPNAKDPPARVTLGVVARKLLHTLHEGLLKAKDIQILAMFAVILLQALPCAATKGPTTPPQPRSRVSSGTTPSRSPELDYFSIRGRRGQLRTSPSISPRLTRLPSTPTTPSPLAQTQSQSSSLSSRGSWSNLFTATSMRQLMSSSTSQDGGSSEPRVSPKLVLSKSAIGIARMPLMATQGMRRQHSALSQQLTIRASEPTKTVTLAGESSPVKAPADVARPTQSRIAWPSSGTPTTRQRTATFSQVVISAPSDSRILERTLHISEDLRQPVKKQTDEELPPEMVEKLVAHIVAYAEMLYAWGLVQQRAQLLKVLQQTAPSISMANDKQPQPQPTLEVTRCCQTCSRELLTSVLQNRGATCPVCVRVSATLCAVCRMPVKGLSHNCVSCLHVTHLRCWDRQRLTSCPTGCGCDCKPVT